MKGAGALLAGVAVPAVIALSAVAGYPLADAASNRPSEGPPAGGSPSGIKTTTISLPGRIANAWDIPPFDLKGLDGKMHRLDEWKGKVILLNFWAPWCGPCQSEIPDFVRYQERYVSQGLQIIGMGLDEERRLRNVARTLGMNYPVLIADPVESPGLQARWGNPTGIVPYTVVIDHDGRLKYIHRGRMEADSFDEFVLPLLSPAGG